MFSMSIIGNYNEEQAMEVKKQNSQNEEGNFQQCKSKEEVSRNMLPTMSGVTKVIKKKNTENSIQQVRGGH